MTAVEYADWMVGSNPRRRLSDRQQDQASWLFFYRCQQALNLQDRRLTCH